MEIFTATGDGRMEAGSRIALAELEVSAGDLEAAATEARRAVAVVAAIPTTRAYALAMLARVQLERGRVLAALESASEAAALLESLGGIDDGESLVRLVHAEALHASGDVQAARSAIAAAHERLIERAALMKDPARRCGFLERVPENARTLLLAHAFAEPRGAESSASAAQRTPVRG